MDKTLLKDTGIEEALPTVFAFQATSWNECVGRPIALKKVFRQKDPGNVYPLHQCLYTIDFQSFYEGFVEMLTEMRFGTLSSPTVQAFMRLCRPVEYTDGIEPTEL